MRGKVSNSVPEWMELTEIRITPHYSNERLKAFVNVTLNGVLAIRGIKVIKGRQGRLFLSMPSRKLPTGAFQDMVYPVCTSMRQWMETQILDRYEEFAAREDDGE